MTADPFTPVEMLQKFVAYLKRTNLPIRRAEVGPVEVDGEWVQGLSATLGYVGTARTLVAAAGSLKNPRLACNKWHKEPDTELGMRIALWGTLSGIPVQIGLALTSNGLRDQPVRQYLLDNVPALTTSEDREWIVVPTDVMQAAANAGGTVD